MRKLFCLVTLLMLASGLAMAQSHQVTTTNAQNEKVVYEISDAPGSKGDTLSITTYNGNSATATAFPSSSRDEDDWDDIDDLDDLDDLGTVLNGLSGVIPSDKTVGETLLALSIILFGIFVLPAIVLIVIVVLIYKNRRAKYKMEAEMAKSGAAGPGTKAKAYASNAKTPTYSSMMIDKGIKNMFLGLGVAILLMFLTGSWTLTAIGLLILLNGAAEFIIGKRHESDPVNENAPQQEATKANSEENKPDSKEPETPEVIEITEE